MSRTLDKMPQVAVLLPTAVKVCRDMRRGVLQYVHRHGPWGLHILEGRQGEQKLVRMREWGCTGIIGRLYTPELVDVALTARVPMILIDPHPALLSPGSPLARHSIVRSDTAAVGRMAARFFLDRKFTQFAFVGEVHGLEWSVTRGQAFADTVQAAGCACSVYATLAQEEQEDAGLERDRLCAWLKSLPKPVALLAAMDNRGRQVLDACSWAGISVPHDIAVLSVDNDEDLCETTTPTMSSILFDAERASYEAAQHLDALMRRATRKRRLIVYGPSHVVARRSTDVSQVADLIVTQAVEFIALNACAGIGVPDVVRHVRASRRLAELRFRRELGHTILDEIQHVRLGRVCTLLRETNQPIGEIIRTCGFDSESHVSTLFRRRFGCTMRDYRKNG
jgi:LacI family transcriptional regulator